MATQPGHATAANVTETFGLEDLPLYVPPGMLLPMQTLESTSSSFADPLVWAAFPRRLAVGAVAEGAVYEDEGDSLAYDAPGTHAWTNASLVVRQVHELSLTVSPTTGSFAGMPRARAHWLQLRGIDSPSAVSCGTAAVTGPASQPGAPLTWWRCGPDGEAEEASLTCPKGAVVVACAKQSVHEQLKVSVSFTSK